MKGLWGDLVQLPELAELVTQQVLVGDWTGSQDLPILQGPREGRQQDGVSHSGLHGTALPC